MMNITSTGKVIAGIALVCLFQSTLAADSLCRRGEKTYFSCSLNNGKIVSLCGNAYVKEQYTNDWIEPENPWLQYRFGLPEKVELAYPLQPKDSLDKFQGDYGTAQQGSVIWKSVSFVSAGIGYKLEYLAPYEADLFDGVRIGDPAKMDIKIPTHRRSQYPEANIPCNGKPGHDPMRFDELARFLTNRNQP